MTLQTGDIPLKYLDHKTQGLFEKYLQKENKPI